MARLMKDRNSTLTQPRKNNTTLSSISTKPKNLWKKTAQALIPNSLNSSILHLKHSEAAGNPRGIQIEYGEMLPKVGVKQLPDYKVCCFLRVLADMMHKSEKEEKYFQAKAAKAKFKTIARIEMRR